MRIGTISFTTIDNYGAVLQAYALAKLLARQGSNDVKIVDYQIPYQKLRDWLQIMHLSYTPTAPYMLSVGLPGLVARLAHIDSFRKLHLPRTAPAWTDDDLRHTAPQFDTLISGSDEIFRTDKHGNIYAPMFLNFADATRQSLHAYAACAGGTIDFGAKTPTIARLLKRFDTISVRDEATQDLVGRLTGTQPPMVLDPTLLWSFEELNLPAPAEKDFILIYGFMRSETTDRMVRAVADKMGLPVISVGWASKYAHRNLMAADPLQWLAYFKHARLIFTNCYHGLMFATRFQRDFLVFETETARYKLIDFTRRLSLSSRLLTWGATPTPEQLAGMDHRALQAALQPFAQNSLQHLTRCCEPQQRRQQNSEMTSPELDSLVINSVPSPVATSNASHNPGLRLQFRQVSTHLAHLFWEAILAPLTCPPILMGLRRKWLETIASSLFLFLVALLQFSADKHMIFLPLYLVPCAWFAIRINQRAGLLASIIAALSGALIQHFTDPDYASWRVAAWNATMRFITIYMIISLLARLCHRWEEMTRLTIARYNFRAEFRQHWAWLAFGGMLLSAIVAVHAHSSPFMMFLPVYMIPCLIVALVMGWGWGSVIAMLATIAGPIVQFFKDADFQSFQILSWNIVMRLIVLQTLVFLVNYIYHLNRSTSSRLPS